MEDNSAERAEKKVDETWKETVEREKESTSQTQQKAARGGQTKSPSKASSFTLFVSSLGMQALVFLGAVPNPATNERELDLNNAQYIIDTLQMLQEKTKNNLTAEESEFLEGTLYELRMHYLEKNKGK